MDFEICNGFVSIEIQLQWLCEAKTSSVRCTFARLNRVSCEGDTVLEEESTLFQGDGIDGSRVLGVAVANGDARIEQISNETLIAHFPNGFSGEGGRLRKSYGTPSYFPVEGAVVSRCVEGIYALLSAPSPCSQRLLMLSLAYRIVYHGCTMSMPALPGTDYEGLRVRE